MRNNALYFPYINVPNNIWFIQILLYWDKVGSIVPSDYIYNPEELDPFMKELVASELVKQIIPYNYTQQIENIEEPFLNYIHSHLKSYRKKYQFNYPYNYQHKMIHIEKLGDIADELVHLRLAKRQDYVWYQVPEWVADSYMAYLASTLAQLDEIDAAPVTNQLDCLHLISENSLPSSRINRLSPLRKKERESFLNYFFPCPTGRIRLNDLVEFKAKHGALLKKFRDKVEEECIELANIADPVHRQEKKDIVKRRFEEEIGEITEAMKHRWQILKLKPLLALFAASAEAAYFFLEPPDTAKGVVAAGVAVGIPLAMAVHEALPDRQYLNKPLAYAALAPSCTRRSEKSGSLS